MEIPFFVRGTSEENLETYPDCPLGVRATIGSAHCKLDCPNYEGTRFSTDRGYRVMCKGTPLE